MAESEEVIMGKPIVILADEGLRWTKDRIHQGVVAQSRIVELSPEPGQLCEKDSPAYNLELLRGAESAIKDIVERGLCANRDDVLEEIEQLRREYSIEYAEGDMRIYQTVSDSLDLARNTILRTPF